MQALRDNEACALEEYDVILDVCSANGFTSTIEAHRPPGIFSRANIVIY